MQSPKLFVWQRVFNKAYEQEEAERGPTFASWRSSFTGLPIPREEMEEYFGQTVARIRDLKARRILEIGCGLGLLLQGLAPDCEVYYGRDISPKAIEAIRRWMRPEDGFRNVDLAVQEALEDWGVDAGAIDSVLINSVIQYFPDEAYLSAVLERAFATLAPGGFIFAGNVKDARLQQALHTSVQFSLAQDDSTVEELRDNIDNALRFERELSVEPQFFRAIHQRLVPTGSVDALLTRGRSDNELTRYRYDVVLRAPPTPVHAAATQIDWDATDSQTDELAAELAQRRPRAIRLRGVLNARLAKDFELLRLVENSGANDVAGLRRQLDLMPPRGQHPEMFWELGAQHGYVARVGPSEKAEEFDVLFSAPAS